MNSFIRSRVTEPAGVMPKRAGLILLAVIAGIIFVASFFSGQTAKKHDVQPSAVVPLGANANQLAEFMKALEKERGEVNDERRRQAERRAKEQELANQGPLEGPQYFAPQEHYRISPPPPVVDQVEQRRKDLEEKAMFASNIALRVPVAEPVVATVLAEHKGSEGHSPRPDRVDVGETRADPPKAQGSGRFVLPKEGPELYRIYQGTLVETKLANALDGYFTGPVKCIVSRDVHSQDGNTVLIPSGAKFFGEARKVEALDQRRLAITFKRLLLPNGYSIDLPGDPGLSKAGETGLKGTTDNHYLRAIGMSGAIGLLGGIALYGGQSGASSYASGVANSTGSSATNILNRFVNVMPTITIREGHPVMVYISTDMLVPEYQPKGQ